MSINLVNISLFRPKWGWRQTLPGYAIGIFGMVFVVPLVTAAQLYKNLQNGLLSR